MPYEPTSAQLATTIRRAQAIVLERLLKVVETSEDEREVRLAAAAILRMKLPDSRTEPETLQSTAKPRRVHPSIPANTPEPNQPDPALQTPLSPDELARLHHLLPHVRPERFTKKHSPTHWRTILARHSSTNLAA